MHKGFLKASRCSPPVPYCPSVCPCVSVVYFLLPSLPHVFRSESQGTLHRQLNHHGNRRFEGKLGVGLNSTQLSRPSSLSSFVFALFPVFFLGLSHSDFPSHKPQSFFPFITASASSVPPVNGGLSSCLEIQVRLCCLTFAETK